MTDTNNTDGAALLPVTQADREAAADYLKNHGYWHVDPDAYLAGKMDHVPLVQAFARQRIATQEDAERSGVGSADARQEIADALHKAACGMLPTEAVGPLDDERSFWLSLADAALSTPQRQEYDGEGVTGLEWTDDGYSLRTPYDGDVDGDGRHVVVGGEVVVTFSDSEVGDEYRERILAALAHPAQATPSAVSGDEGEG